MQNHRWILLLLHATLWATGNGESEMVRCPDIKVDNIRREAIRYELSFIFYYTSWSNASLEARKVYNAVAELFDEQFHYFAEVDCWHASCNCTGTHDSGNGLPSAWPTLIINFARRVKIQYYGEWTKGDLIRFINRLYTPFDRLLTKQDATPLLQYADAVLLGTFPNSYIAEFRHFVVACLQWLEVDPNLSFRCAATFFPPDKKRTVKNSKTGSHLALIYDRRNIGFDNPKGINNSHIITWLHSELKNSFANMTAYNSPATLALLTQRSPVLAIIVNDIHLYKHYKKLLTEYRFTRDNPKRLPYPNVNYCRRLLKEPKPKNFCLIRLKDTCFNYNKIDHIYLKHYYMWNIVSDYLWKEYLPVVAENDMYYFNVKTNDLLTRLYKTNLCYQEANQLITPQHKVKLNKYLQRRADVLFKKYNYMGRNSSLAIVIMNRLRYKDFVEKQGLVSNDSIHKNTPIVAIFDTFHESVYMLQENFTSRNIENFMIRYYKGELKRHMIVAESPDYQDVMVGGDAIFLDDYSPLDMQTFHKKQDVNLAVLFYGPYCGLSGMISNLLTQVANFLRSSRSEIKFGRFNIQENSLPWHLEMPRVPVLAIFPKGNYANSKIYPARAENTFENVLAFIISQLEPTQQVKSILHSCKHFAQMRHLFLSCLEYSRNLITGHVNNFLKLWHINRKERDLIMERLRNFKTLGDHIQKTYKL